MKKLGLLILGFIIGAVLTYLFCPRVEDGENINQLSAAEAKIKAPRDTITVAEATRLFKNWQRNNPTEIDSTLEVVGSRKITTNVEWSLDVVREYLDYAEKKSDSLGYTMTGIAVYMGNYGEDKSQEKMNRNTMFIVPTGDKNLSKASALNLGLVAAGNTGTPPLNQGSGGNANYP